MNRYTIVIVLSMLLISFGAFASGQNEPASVETAVEDSQDSESSIKSSSAALEQLGNSGMIIIEEDVNAPDFTLPTLDGEEISLSDYRGKVVMLNFWATWCGPCRIEMPSMQDLYTDLESEDFVIIAVNAQEEPSIVQDFMDENKYTFPVVLDVEGRALYQYGIRAFPTTYIISPEGKVLAGKPGAHIYDGEMYRQIFRSLM